jgi:hypothetical protein
VLRDDGSERMADDVHAVTPTALRTRITACTKRSIENGPCARAERADPGRSGRMHL